MASRYLNSSANPEQTEQTKQTKLSERPTPVEKYYIGVY
jgi:hypothetical protein